jgi:hypothetical protein
MHACSLAAGMSTVEVCAYLPYVSETGTVFESWQIGQSCTNLRPPPWTTLGRAPRLCWGVIMPPNLSNLFDSSATIIIFI